MALLLQIEQAADGGHEYIESSINGFDLRLFRDAAEDHADFKAEALAVGFEAFSHLHREFASGGKDEAAHAPAKGLTRIPGEAVEHG